MTLEEADRLRQNYHFEEPRTSGKLYKKFIPVTNICGGTIVIAEQPYQKFMKNKKIDILGFETTEDSILVKYQSQNSRVVGIVEFKDVSPRIKEKE